ncbi:tetratricopeptide repeat-containing diguanylate cyclase [Undibacterium terreum]|uniref:diguanylate cyclase n=1 Tax=Undibacterium terreum TaxID=1224302 RepID=A0A916UT05_9BURK|nr:diguanylate cyclase [Undibacterium terreum]GGC86458.1 GGDEF domain-containing protein [Undibacterium terreum]
MSHQSIGNLQYDSALSRLLADIEAAIDSRPDQTIGLLEQAVRLAEQEGGLRLLSELYCKLGNCRIIFHDPMGMRDFEAALEYAEQSKSLDLKVDILHGLARAFIAFGDTNSALEYCEKAIALLRQIDDQQRYPHVLITLGVVFLFTHQFERGIEIFRDAAALCQSIADKGGLARSMNNWADSLVSLYEELREAGKAAEVGMLDDAINFARQSLVYAHESGMVRIQLMANETLAHALEERGEYSQALQQLESSLHELSGLGFTKEELDIKVRIGALLIRMDKIPEAINSLVEARDVALRLGNYPHLSDLLKMMSSAQESCKDFAAALTVYKEFHAVTLKSRDQRAQISAQIFAAKMDLERVQQEAEAHKSRVNQLEDFNRTLRVQVHEDMLTGLPNRRALEDQMEQRLTGRTTNITFAMADIDFFKQVNDTHSHLVGDDVLRHVGALIRSCLRSGDMAARIGGEEFALVLDRTKEARSVEACNRIRKAIENYDWGVIAPGLRVTMSFGVTHIQTGDDLKGMMTRADSALYRAKRNGRNRVEKA